MEKGHVANQGLFPSSHLEVFAPGLSCAVSTGGAQKDRAGTAASVGTLLLPLHHSPFQPCYVTLSVAEGLRDSYL